MTSFGELGGNKMAIRERRPRRLGLSVVRAVFGIVVGATLTMPVYAAGAATPALTANAAQPSLPAPPPDVPILNQDPPEHTLKAGAIVLVDDGSCGSGKMKEDVIGQAATPGNKGYPRISGCIVYSVTPTVSACGTLPSGPRGGRGSGEVVEGDDAAGCTITFAIPQSQPPVCVLTAQAPLQNLAYSISATTVTVAHDKASHVTLDWICRDN